MHIPTHQIHNVLNAYAKQLKKKASQLKNKPDATRLESPETDSEQINAYSVENKSQLILNKIISDIVDKLKIEKQKNSNEKTKSLVRQKKFSERDYLLDRFTYNTITKDGEKIKTHIEIRDSDFLIKQVEQISRKLLQD